MLLFCTVQQCFCLFFHLRVCLLSFASSCSMRFFLLFCCYVALVYFFFFLPLCFARFCVVTDFDIFRCSGMSCACSCFYRFWFYRWVIWRFLLLPRLQVPIDGDLLADGDGLSVAEQVNLGVPCRSWKTSAAADASQLRCVCVL